MVEVLHQVAEQEVSALGTALQSLVLLSAARYFIHVNSIPSLSLGWQKRTIDRLGFLLDKMHQAHQQKKRSSNNHLTQYVRRNYRT
jgi:hypothetical protein